MAIVFKAMPFGPPGRQGQLSAVMQ
jgi:hypothetical protein